MKGALYAVAATLSLIISMPAIAQTTGSDELAAKFATCAAMADKDARLACYDETAASPHRQAAAPAEELEESAWTIQESRSPIDDTPQIYAGNMPGELMLLLRCKEKSTDVLLSGKTFMGINRSPEVIIRIGDAPAAKTKWSGLTTSMGAIIDGQRAISFIRSLPSHGTLFVRLIGYSSSEDAKFELRGIDAVREKIGKACNWKPAPAKAPGAK